MIDQDFKSIFELLKAFPDEQTCIEYLEYKRWLNGVVSPFDSTAIVYKCSGNRYKCKNTGKYFNVRTNTMFDNSKLPLQKWFLAIYLVTGHKKGISSCQLAKDIHVTQKTSWFLIKRIHNCFGIECLENEVEADETYIGGKNKNRHKSKKIEHSQGRSVKDKTPVFGMVERRGLVIAKVVDNTQSSTLLPQIQNAVKPDSFIYTDEWQAYIQLNLNYNHLIVHHGAGQYVVIDKAHTNTIEGFWSHLKRMIIGVHHSVSRKHLQLYVDSQTFRYNTRKISESHRFNLLLQNTEHRLTYKKITYNEKEYDKQNSLI